MQDNRHRHPNHLQSQDRPERIPESQSGLSDLTKKEQEHRHQWQDQYLKSQNTTFRFGQLFGFIYNLALLYLVYDLIQQGEKKLALVIFIINALVVFFGLFLTSSTRRTPSRKPSRNNDRRFQSRDNRDRKDHHQNRNRDRDNRDRDQNRNRSR